MSRPDELSAKTAPADPVLRGDEAAAQLQLAAELADIAVWRHDLLSDRIHYSVAAWRVLDLPPRPEGLSLQEVRALIHPDDMPQVLASAERALAVDTPVDMRARYRRSDGSWRDVLTRRVVQRDADGRAIAFLGVAMDITEQTDRQQREQALSRRLEMAASAAGVAIWSYHVGDAHAEWNEQAHTMHGLPIGEPPPGFDAYVQRFVHPDDRAALRASFQRLADQADGYVEQDVRIVRSDGQERVTAARTRAERNTRGVHLFGVMLDVTDRRIEQQALLRADQRAALAARGAGIGTWELDQSSGDGWWDEQMWRLRGLEPREQAPVHAERIALVHPDDIAVLEAEYAAANREARPSRAEFRVRLPDGRWRWLASRSMPVADAQGRIVRRIGINWDITDAREAEAARRAEDLARRSSQAKSQFLARMSHELRTPLNAVIGFTQLLLADDPRVDAAMRRRQLEHIRGAGEHLLALINDALDLSSLESGEMRLDMTAVALDPLVRGTLPLVAELAAQRQVTFELGALEGTMRADPTRLRQVLINLLSNAVKYNRTGGRVTIDSVRDDGHLVLRVTDTGRGMTPRQLQHAFEPFNRLGAEKENIEGTGIGLAIVRATMERMGGLVRLHSQAGEGSRVEVRLPAVDGPAAAPAPPPPTVAAPAAALREARVLYIEDNPVNMLIVSEVVKRRGGLLLEGAASGQAGLDAAVARRPDLILVDMQLPDFDGHEVLRRLRSDARTAGIPCVALSANAMPEDIERALASGFSDYWTKPLDVRSFLAALDRRFGPAAG